jgi:3-oxoadipate enol-lactonase
MPKTQINGFQMNYRVEGEGPPLVMAHGLLASIATMAVFGDVSDLLMGSFRVVNYDAKGHGESGYTTNPVDYEWEGLAEDMFRLLRYLGIERAHIGGGSLGAGTCLVFAADHPEMVEKLVLISPPPIGQQASAPLASLWGGLARLIEGLGLEEAVDVALRLEPWGALRESAPVIFEWIRQWLLSQDPEGIVLAIQGIVNGPALPVERFAEIRAPALIIAHPDDEMHPSASAEVLHECIAGSRLVMAPDALYYSVHREEMAQLIKDFLNGS